MIKKSILLICFFLMVMAFSCSSKTIQTTPVFPDELNANPSEALSLSDGYVNSTRGVLGIWKVHLDIDSMTAEIIPARNALAIGQIFDADLSQFLEVAPCANCISIPSIYFDSYEDLNVVVRMKHPFPNINSRPDLHGFDVRAIFVLPINITYSDIKITKPNGTEENADFSLSVLLNPDGYTSHFDELVTDPRYFMGGSNVAGNLNPFLRFFESYSTPVFDPHAPTGYNVMPVGSGQYERTAVFDDLILTDILDFYIVADVSYGQSAVLANRQNPQYYLPAFNRTEPWRVEYWVENNTLTPFDPSSSADLVVQVFDWQHGATVDPEYPDPSNLSGIPEKSDVLRVELSIPGLQNDPVIVTTPEAGDGSPTNPLQYRLTVTNQNTAGNERWGLLAIRDDLYGQPAPQGRIPIPTSPAGFPYETVDIRDYALYLPVIINLHEDAMMCDEKSYFDEYKLCVPWKDQFAEKTLTTASTVIHPDFIMDKGHKKFQYRWDYDYDGVTFNVNGAGIPSPTIEFPTGGKKDVGLRVRTNAVPPREYIFTVPIYAEGTGFRETIPPTVDTKDIASQQKGHAVAATSEMFYAVYSRDEGTARNIWLLSTDRTGNEMVRRITDSTHTCFNPVIEVIEYGTNAGIYVVYSEYDGSSAFLYSTYGNLDGSGFQPSHVKRITSATNVIEFEPCLVYINGKLCVYYSHFLLFVSWIHGAHSDDFAQTWIEDGAILNNTSNAQIYPCATDRSFSRVYIVWEDWMNSTDYGVDIWMAKSSDGVVFTDLKNITPTQGKIYEAQPSCSSYGSQLAVAYTSRNYGSTQEKAMLKIINTYSNTEFDMSIYPGSGTNLTHTQPCVATADDNRFLIAYGSYNQMTQYLNCLIVEIIASGSTGYYTENVILNESIGTIGSANSGAEVYAGLVSYSPVPTVSENFCVFRNYNDGSYQSLLEPIEICSHIDMMYFVTELEY